MNVKDFSRYFITKEYIGGLSFRDGNLNFLLFAPDASKKILATFEAELPEGTVVEGVLQKPEALKPILDSLRHSPALRKIKHLYLIVSLESGTVYHKVFDLPQVEAVELAAAVELNLKMLSPIKFEESYSDWELMGDIISHDSFKYRINSVFAKKEIVDPYLKILGETDFIPLAVEFNAFGLWRLFNENNLLDESKSYLIAFLSSDGLDFSVVKKAGLQFSYCQSWRESMQSLGISSSSANSALSQEGLLKIFTEELRKVITFYLNRFQEGVSGVFLFTPGYQEELVKIIKEQFRLEVLPSFSKLEYSPNFYAAAGAALRGLISRVDDVSVSLMTVGTEEEYRRRRTLSFLNLWTKIIFTTLILLIAVSFGVKTFFNVTEKSLAESSGNLNLKIDSQKLTELETSAKNFNSVVGQAIAAQSNTKDWSGFFRAWQAAGPDVQVQRMLVKSSDFLVSLSGWVNTQEKMLSFKNKLAEATEYFSDVDIPLASIIQQKNGVEFNLNLKIKKLP
ncbi:MAG TPA: hypothetical protein P5524_00420 [Candidatus Paceibacterota bacterium]|nr:hypothetical protein [Candidatus Paceibacterota bacterium]